MREVVFARAQRHQGISMPNSQLSYRRIQQILDDLWQLGFSDAALARFINCRPETIGRVRRGDESGRNIAERLLIMADAYNQCRLPR
jgi:hypothetical protein